MNKDLERRIDKALMRRDFAEVDRLMALRLAKGDDPLVKGGQGRTEQDLLDDGSYLVFLCVVAVAMAAGVGIWALIGEVLTW